MKPSDQEEYRRASETAEIARIDAGTDPDASGDDTAGHDSPATGSRPDARSGSAARPPTVTMPLLDLITRQSMDEDYTVVAERKRAAGVARGAAQPGGRRSAAVTLGVVAATALLATVAGVQTSRNADVTALGRASLVERIQLAKENVRELQQQAGELRQANVESEERLRSLRERESQLSSRVRRVGAGAGFLAVRGPGIRVKVDDSADGKHTVRDSDLALLVDGLWAAGAEAIAINGQRLTALTSIQNSGQAIHVNVRPLAPPYRVDAVGDPDAMEGRLQASTSGATFRGVAEALDFRVTVEDVDELQVPATRVRQLRHAERLLQSNDERAPQEDDE